MADNSDNDGDVQRIISAPSYLELFNQVRDLRCQVDALSKSSNRASSVRSHENSVDQSVMDFRIMPDLNKSVKTFTGRENTIEAGDWLETVDGLANMNGWPLNFRLQFVRANVTGAARSWFGGEHFSTWDEFLNRFRLIFVREARMSDRWDLMKKRVQAKDEHLLEYYLDKVRLCKDLNMGFLEIKDHVLQSLYSRELAIYALGKSHLNSDSLLADLLDWQRLSKLRSQQFADNRNFRNKKYHAVGDETKAVSRENDVENSTHVQSSSRPATSTSETVVGMGPRTRSTREVKCYNCNGMGHFSRDCIKPRRPMKCGLCKAEGHTRGCCPQDQSSQSFQVEINTVYPQGPYVKDAHINGTMLQVLVDTGCSVCLIRSSSAIKTGVPLEQVTRPLYVVGDMKNPGLTTVGEMHADIVVGEVHTTNHKVLIVPDTAIPMDMLLGRDWLDLPNVNYYKSGDNFVIAPVSADKQLMDEISPNMLDLTIDNLCVFQVDSKQTTNWRANQISRGDDPGYREQCTQFQQQPLTLSQFKIGNNATETERNQLMQLVNEFRDVFATSLAELGCTNVLTMDIPEVPGSVPVHSKPFRTSPSDRRIIADILQDWRSNGIISDSNSPYASPVILVNKASGEKRLCIDYRKLNKQTTCRPYPMPDIDSQLSILSTGNLFTTLDLANGFLQIPLSEEAKDKTAFVTEGETARFNRMPFGLCGAPGTFQKLMNIIFKDLRNQGIVGLYLDDIILPAKDWPELLKNLRRVFVVLRNAKLTLKPSKCIFGSRELDYLGFKISPGHIQPGQKISSITSYPVPKNVLEVRQFLGLTGFFRRFVPNYATLASPLSCLLKKNATFRWRTADQGGRGKSHNTLRIMFCRLLWPRTTIRVRMPECWQHCYYLLSYMIVYTISWTWKRRSVLYRPCPWCVTIYPLILNPSKLPLYIS